MLECPPPTTLALYEGQIKLGSQKQEEGWWWWGRYLLVCCRVLPSWLKMRGWSSGWAGGLWCGTRGWLPRAHTNAPHICPPSSSVKQHRRINYKSNQMNRSVCFLIVIETAGRTCHSITCFTCTTSFSSGFSLSHLWELTPIHLPCAGQSLTVWPRKLNLQLVSCTDDEAHTAAPAGN